MIDLDCVSTQLISFCILSFVFVLLLPLLCVWIYKVHHKNTRTIERLDRILERIHRRRAKMIEDDIQAILEAEFPDLVESGMTSKELMHLIYIRLFGMKGS